MLIVVTAEFSPNLYYAIAGITIAYQSELSLCGRTAMVRRKARGQRSGATSRNVFPLACCNWPSPGCWWDFATSHH